MNPVSEGQMLGKYRLLEPLGRGGMAQVYRAYHPQLDRYVAIKVLRSDLVEEEQFLVRFQREARAVAALRHTNIVQVFDSDVQDDVYYMVMELLEGDTLKARLADYRARGERMPAGEMVRALLDVLDGLAYAHSEGMIHRDIKPANIMLTKRGQAVVADFGIAQIVGGTRHTASGALMGTLNYIAPEQGLQGHSDARSDLYSLGIVFYEMLTQRTPFDADTPLAVLMKHLNDPLPLPRQVAPDIPDSFERVVLKALAKNPEDRYQNAEEMAQALRKAAEESAIELPERISLPLSFKTPQAPSESVAVLSGTERHKITDEQFAAGDTDATLGRRLASSEPSVEAARGGGWKIIVGALFFAIACNSLAFMAAGIAGQGGFFTRGWPIVVLTIGLFLCAVMYATREIWILVPAGIFVGNGVILSYYALTGNWDHWRFLWPLEPLLLVCVIGLPLFLSGQRGYLNSGLSRLLAAFMGLLALALVGLVILIALMAG
ncbi:MAG: serine/threonine protein kinase [Thermoflexales bacterium]|nr:serine/threonine protein kinase [Thermoflexales bacterium]